MKSKIITTIKYLLYIIIPLLSVMLNVLLKTSQGERNEEIAFGILLGIILDFLYSILILITNKSGKFLNIIIFIILLIEIIFIVTSFAFSYYYSL